MTEETIIEKDTCTPMFIEALLTLAKTWKQPGCPSTDEWIKKTWYRYIMEYYSAMNRIKTGSFVVIWLKLESVIQSRVSQKEKNKYHILTHIYGILENGAGGPLYREEAETQTQGPVMWTQRGKKRVGQIESINIYTLPCVK